MEPLISDEHPDEFFLCLLGDALESTGVTLSSQGCFRVGHILKRPLQGNIDITVPLATRYLEAQQRGIGHLQRVKLLRDVGDDALLLCGFFWQHVVRLYRHDQNIRYHIAMGRRAYRQVGGQMHEELAAKFEALVEVMMHISDACGMGIPDDIERLAAMLLGDNHPCVRSAFARRSIVVLPNVSRAPS